MKDAKSRPPLRLQTPCLLVGHCGNRPEARRSRTQALSPILQSVVQSAWSGWLVHSQAQLCREGVNPGRRYEVRHMRMLKILNIQSQWEWLASATLNLLWLTQGPVIQAERKGGINPD